VNIAATRLGVKSAVDAVDGDVARPGANFHIARSHFVDHNVAAPRFNPRRTGKLVPANISRSRLEIHFARESRQFQIARSALQVDIALKALDRLIAAAGVAVNRGVLWRRDFVVDGNVVDVHVVDTNAVAVLANGRIGLQLPHVLFVISAEP